MKIKKIYRLIAAFLLITLIMQPFQLTSVKAASGASVTGASGTQYTLDHQYVKQLNINTGNITITDTGYTQTNGNSENWDANEDAYVIKGQGTSTNTITINNTNYVPTIYLLETEWAGNIAISNSKGCNIVIVGSVKNTNGYGLTMSGNTSTSSPIALSVIGLNRETSKLSVSKNVLGRVSGGYATYAKSFLMKDLELSCTSIATGTYFYENVTIADCSITSSVTTYGNYSFNTNSAASFSISNLTANFLAIERTSGSIYNTDLVSISSSNIDRLILTSSFRYGCKITNTTINTATIGTVNNLTLNNAVIHNFETFFYADTVNMIESTIANKSLTNSNTIVTSYKLDHSSYNDAGEGWVLDVTPTNSAAEDLFLKKVRLRDYPNYYVLVTFPDGYTSKLLLDENGYLYPFVPKNSTELKFQVTDEKGAANFGNYELEFDPITGNDTNTNEPAITIQPTVVTFTPFANLPIEYSFDKDNWTGTTTDSNCQFSVVFPEGVRKIYLRYNEALYVIDYDESGTPGEVIELKPEITSQSGSNVTLLKGKEGSIYVNASPVNTGTILKYQWYKDSSLLSGEKSNVLVIKNPDDLNAGDYICVVTEDEIGSTTSDPISVSVTTGVPEETALVILAQSSSKSVTEDSKVELYVIPNSTDGVNYQWKKNGVNIPGATTATYEISAVEKADEATYTNVLTKGSEVVTSDPIVLTVNPNPLAGDVEDLQSAVDTLTEQVNTLQGQLDAANNSLTTLQNTINDLTAQLNDLNNQIAALQTQISNLNGNVTELQDQINALQDQKNNLQIDLDAANTEKSTLQITINELNTEVSNKDTQITYLQTLLNASESENAELKSQITVLNTQINNMTTQIETLNAQVTTITSERDSLQNQLTTANTIISNLQQQILDLTNENNDLKSQLDTALLQIILLQGQVNNLTTQNTELVNQVNDLNAEITLLKNQLDGAGDNTSELLQQISNLTTQVNNLTTIINQKDSQITSLNDQITNLNTTIVNLQTEVNNALDSLSDYEGAALQDKINQILSENAELKSDLNSLKQERNSLLLQLADLNNLIQSLQAENASLIHQLQEAETLINNLQSSLTAEIEKSIALQSQVDTLNIQISNLQLQLGQTESDKEALNQQINNLQTDLTNITYQLNVSTQTIADLNSQITALNTTIINLQIQINNALSELTEYEGNNLLEKIQDIKTKQSTITADLSEANALNTSLNSQLNTANTLLISLQHQIDVLMGQLNDKDAQIAELLALIAEKDTEIAGKNTQISNLQIQVQTLQETINNLSGGNDTITKLTEQINELKNQLEAKNTEISNLQKKIEELQNAGGSQSEINKLTDELNKAKDIISNLQKQIDELKKNPITVYVPVPADNNGVSDEVADTTIPETIVKEVNPDKVDSIVKDPVISDGNATVEAREGWEISTSLAKDAVWSGSLLPVTENYTGLYTFFDNGLSVDAAVKGAALTVGYNGISNAGLTDTKDGFMKYTFYARRVIDKNNIYVCSVDIEKEEYTTPVTNITSSILKEPRNYTPENSYNVLADKAITFKLSADYGTYGKGAIKYQLVPESMDFDPDGTWINVKGNSFTIPKQDNNFRIYVKFIDKNGNYTVDKTIGFKIPEEKVSQVTKDDTSPIFTMYKTIYLGYDYQVQLANVTGDVTYKSSDANIAKVNKNGLITSVNEGKAIITCSVKGKRSYTYRIVVTIADGKGSPTLNLVTPPIQATGDSPVLIMYKQLKVGTSTKLSISGLDKDATVMYINMDSDIAVASKDGTITGITKGSTDVMAIVSKGDINYIYYIKIRVDDGTKDTNMWTYLTAA